MNGLLLSLYAIIRDNKNAVGYMSGTSIDQNNFKTVSFSGIGYNTADIQQIKIDDGGAQTIGWGAENFSIWEGVPSVAEGSGFTYWDPMYGDGVNYFWGDESCTPASFSIAQGQAVVIECSADLTVTTSGQVPTEKVEFTSIEQNNFTGNPFPVEIDIQNIKIDDGGAGTIGWGAENFSIWEGIPTVREGSGFTYWAPDYGDGEHYFWGDESCVPVEYPIAPGQGVVIECSAGLTISIVPPYSL